MCFFYKLSAGYIQVHFYIHTLNLDSQIWARVRLATMKMMAISRALAKSKEAHDLAWICLLSTTVLLTIKAPVFSKYIVTLQSKWKKTVAITVNQETNSLLGETVPREHSKHNDRGEQCRRSLKIWSAGEAVGFYTTCRRFRRNHWYSNTFQKYNTIRITHTIWLRKVSFKSRKRKSG